MYKLMIVEDEQIVRRGFMTMIDWESIGFTISAEAANGKRALECLAQDIPDVILTDIKMPIMDGLKLMSEVNIRYPQIKMVVLSGYGDFSYAQHAIQCGVLGYIVKPSKEEEVYATFKKVKNILDNRYNPVIPDRQIQAGFEEFREEEDDPIIVRIKEYIDENFSQKITLDTMAEIAYMNPSYFSTFFKQKTGCNYNDYLTKVRMEKAKDLIQTTDLKIYYIAMMVGYDDNRYFSKLFKTVTGKSPSEFRKERSRGL